MIPPAAQQVSAEWRRMAVHAHAWEATAEERPGGEAQGYFVSCAGIRGYLKPTNENPPVGQHPRAAHEKIAADLAFDLRLPVPAAILVDGIKCGCKVQASVVSLVVFPEVQKWQHAIANPAALAIAHNILRSTRGYWSGMLAFDTWIQNTDRNNAGNVLVGTDPKSDPALSAPIFCDHANSLLQAGWKEGTPHVPTLPPLLPVLADFCDKNVAMQTAEQIANFPDQAVSEIVERIPHDYLSAQQKAIIVDGLLKRKQFVPDVIAKLPAR
jgi:hypothetical protein